LHQIITPDYSVAKFLAEAKLIEKEARERKKMERLKKFRG